MQIALAGQVQADASMSNWTLLNGTGDRYYDVPIQFQVALGTAPTIIHVNLATVDADNGFNLRVDVQAVSLTPSGFTLRMHTWANTKLYRVSATWIAMTS
jgi:hypothetical protein